MEANNDCVEVAFAVTEVAVPDSNNAEGPMTALGVDAWRTFTARRFAQ
jgi:hypothetical protein